MSNFFLSLIQAMFPDTAMFRFCMLSAGTSGQRAVADAPPALVIPDGDHQVVFMNINIDGGNGEWHYSRFKAGDACFFTADEVLEQVYERGAEARRLLAALDEAERITLTLDGAARDLGLDTDTVLEKNEAYRWEQAEKARWAEFRARAEQERPIAVVESTT